MPVKRLTAVIAVAATLAGLGGVLAGVAVANHQFPDVASGNAYHDNIDNFVNAGCATGFPDGTFQPQEPVKRQQMARFVNACGGRLWFDEAIDQTVTTSLTTAATAEMVSAAVGDGAGFVLVNVSAQASIATAAGFPCQVTVQLGTGLGGRTLYLDMPAAVASDIEDESGSMQQYFVLPGGGNTIQQVQVSKNADCTSTVKVNVQVSATYWPFDGAGNGGGESAPVAPPAAPERG